MNTHIQNLVVIPAFNAAHTISETINSLQMQTVQDWHAVIIDDCSTDNTVSVVREFQDFDSRITLIESKRNAGPGVARNLAFDQFLDRAENVFFLDSDDIAARDRIELQSNFLREHPDFVGVGSWVQLFGSRDGLVTPAVDPDEIASLLLFTCEFVMPSFTVRASVLRDNNMRFLPAYIHEDWELGTRLARQGKIGNIPAPLVKYRRHASQTTVTIHNSATDLAANLRFNHLEWLGIERSKIDIETHVAVSPCYLDLVRDVPKEAFSVGRVNAWKAELLGVAKRQSKINPKVLESVIYRVFDSASL